MVSDELLIGAAFTVHPRAPENMPASERRVSGVGKKRRVVWSKSDMLVFSWHGKLWFSGERF